MTAKPEPAQSGRAPGFDYWCRWCGRWYRNNCPWRGCKGHKPEVPRA